MHCVCWFLLLLSRSLSMSLHTHTHQQPTRICVIYISLAMCLPCLRRTKIIFILLQKYFRTNHFPWMWNFFVVDQIHQMWAFCSEFRHKWHDFTHKKHNIGTRFDWIITRSWHTESWTNSRVHLPVFIHLMQSYGNDLIEIEFSLKCVDYYFHSFSFCRVFFLRPLVVVRIMR